ncbi:hypothetical protein [Kutzneria kofuensis]
MHRAAIDDPVEQSLGKVRRTVLGAHRNRLLSGVGGRAWRGRAINP